MKNTSVFLSVFFLVAGIALSSAAAKKPQNQPGYSDTPFLPGGKWRVHDSARPRPKVVDPGPIEKQKGFPFHSPKGAVVLIDGKSLSAWTGRGG